LSDKPRIDALHYKRPKTLRPARPAFINSQVRCNNSSHGFNLDSTSFRWERVLERRWRNKGSFIMEREPMLATSINGVGVTLWKNGGLTLAIDGSLQYAIAAYQHAELIAICPQIEKCSLLLLSVSPLRGPVPTARRQGQGRQRQRQRFCCLLPPLFFETTEYVCMTSVGSRPLNDITLRIGSRGTMVDVYSKEIAK